MTGDNVVALATASRDRKPPLTDPELARLRQPDRNGGKTVSAQIIPFQRVRREPPGVIPPELQARLDAIPPEDRARFDAVPPDVRARLDRMLREAMVAVRDLPRLKD